MPVLVLRTVKVMVRLSSDEWELYTNMEGSTECATALNKALASLVDQYCEQTDENAIKVHEEMLKVLKHYDKFGAHDTEPRWRLRCIMRQVYQIETDIL